uniref:Uncharacterized protein n=1 Tax=Asparagus officinalis TaxID=4686 RepID=Q2XNV1_ASPOF|nr:hypothetical protein 12.t00036 [Asparagus officinalis]
MKNVPSDPKTRADDLNPNAVKDPSPASKETRSNVHDNSLKVKELPVESAPVLTKRARQRQRQYLTRQFAKALDQVDELYYQADLEFRNRQVAKLSPQQASGISSQPPTNEWIRILVRKAKETQMEKAVKRSPRSKQIWMPKAKSMPKAKARGVAPQPSSTLDLAHSAPTPSVKPYGGVDLSRVKNSIEGSPQFSTRRSRQSACQGTLGTVEGTPSKHPDWGSCDSKCVTPTKANNVLFTQIKTRQTDERVIPKNSCKQLIGYSDRNVDELYYRAGGTNKSRKRGTRKADSHCLCTKIIKAVLSACSCPKTSPQRVSVFKRISTEASKPKSRHFHKRRSVVQDDELPSVTINVVDKGKSLISSNSSNPNLSPGRRVNSGITQRISQLQLEAIGHNDYPGIHEGIHSDGELSDSYSALASDDTTSSIGQAREVFMINTEQIDKIIEDALAKQKEAFKIKMEMTMQEMRQMHDQQIRPLSNQLGESSHRSTDNQAGRIQMWMNTTLGVASLKIMTLRVVPLKITTLGAAPLKITTLGVDQPMMITLGVAALFLSKIVQNRI